MVPLPMESVALRADEVHSTFVPLSKADLLLAPAKVPRNCQIWQSHGEYGCDIAILGNSVAAYSDPVA